MRKSADELLTVDTVDSFLDYRKRVSGEGNFTRDEDKDLLVRFVSFIKEDLAVSDSEDLLVRVNKALKEVDGSLNFYNDRYILCFKNGQGMSDMREFSTFKYFLVAVDSGQVK